VAKKDQAREALAAQVACVLRTEREKKGMSLNALAEQAGLSRQMISYIEQDLRNPSLDTLLRICDALEILLEEVVRRARKEVS